jgi:hypothetical protein
MRKPEKVAVVSHALLWQHCGMGYDIETVERIRRLLSARSDVVEKRIVGGALGFMVGGHLCCAVSVRGLTVRVGAEGKAEALGEPHVGRHLVGNRETRAFVVVEPDGYRDDAALAVWLERGLRFVGSL